MIYNQHHHDPIMHQTSIIAQWARRSAVWTCQMLPLTNNPWSDQGRTPENISVKIRMDIFVYKWNDTLHDFWLIMRKINDRPYPAYVYLSQVTIIRRRTESEEVSYLHICLPYLRVVYFKSLYENCTGTTPKASLDLLFYSFYLHLLCGVHINVLQEKCISESYGIYCQFCLA